MTRPIDLSGFWDPECEPAIGCADLCCALPEVDSNGDPIPLDVSQQVGLAAIKVATSLMREALGNQFGICAYTVLVQNCPQCFCRPCRCNSWPSISVASVGLPIKELIGVVIDGAEVPLSAFLVKNHTTIMRVDGGDWGCCTSENPMSPLVRARFGNDVNHLVVAGVADLACEILSGCRKLGCTLPVNVESISAHGVSILMRTINERTSLTRWLLGLPRWDEMVRVLTRPVMTAMDPDDYVVSHDLITWVPGP